jgi:hypothetical protein
VRQLNALVLVSLVAVMAAGCSSTVTTTTNDPDAQSVVDSLIPAAFGHWNVNALVAVADPAVYTPARVQRARLFFSELSSKLGEMVAYNKAHGTTQISGSGADQIKKASYDAVVVFRKGTATVHIEAAKKQGRWLIEDASVQPSQHLLVH